MLVIIALSEAGHFLIAMQIPHLHHWENLIDNWGDDAVDFVRRQAPKIVFVAIATYLAILLLHWLAKRAVRLRTRHLPSGVRAQQVQTLASVTSNVGSYAIGALGALEILSLFGLNLEPLLASAGIVGLAVGFGSQALVKDVINGFFILLDDQYGIGDAVRVGGVRGTVEDMSLRRTVLRDEDGSVHTVPNSEIRVVSNLSRDWAQTPLTLTVSASESGTRIREIVDAVGAEMAADPALSADLVMQPTFAGLDRINSGNADYLILIRARPTRQAVMAREMRRRLKERLEQENIQSANAPARVYVADN